VDILVQVILVNTSLLSRNEKRLQIPSDLANKKRGRDPIFGTGSKPKASKGFILPLSPRTLGDSSNQMLHHTRTTLPEFAQEKFPEGEAAELKKTWMRAKPLVSNIQGATG